MIKRKASKKMKRLSPITWMSQAHFTERNEKGQEGKKTKKLKF